MKTRGFTLIELIVVMVIIGILVLLATPKFLNYMEMAKLTQIKHDVKVAENVALADYIKTGKIPEGFQLLEDENIIIKDIEEGLAYNTIGKINSYAREKSIKNFKNEGKVEEDTNIVDISKEYYRIPKSFVKGTIGSRLKGEFIINKDMEGIYMDKFVPEEDLEEDGQLEEDSEFKWVYYDGLNLEIYKEKFDIFKNVEDSGGRLTNDEKMYYSTLNDMSSKDYDTEKVKGKLYDFKYYEKIDYKMDHSENMEIVITGFKDDLDKKPEEIIIPDSIKCSLGHVHNVVGVGEIENYNEGAENSSFGKYDTFNRLVIPSNIKYIGHMAFQSLDIRDILFENHKISALEFIGDVAFGYIGIKRGVDVTIDSPTIKLYLPENIKLIGSLGFSSFDFRIRDRAEQGNEDLDYKYGNMKLEIQNLDSLDELIYLGTRAFQGENTTYRNNKLIHPKNLIFMGEEAFGSNFGNSSQYYPFNDIGVINELEISKNNNIKIIGSRDYFRRMKLERVDIPDNIRYIDRNAFNNYAHSNKSYDKPSKSDLEKYEDYIKYITIGENVEFREISDDQVDGSTESFPYKFQDAYKSNSYKKGHYKRVLDSSGENWIWMYSEYGSSFEDLISVGRYEYQRHLTTSD